MVNIIAYIGGGICISSYIGVVIYKYIKWRKKGDKNE